MVARGSPRRLVEDPLRLSQRTGSVAIVHRLHQGRGTAIGVVTSAARLRVFAAACLICLALLAGGPVAAAGVRSRNGRVHVEAAGVRLDLERATGQPAAGGLTLTEGVKAAPVALGAPEEWRVTPTAAACTRRAEGGLSVETEFRTRGALEILLTFRNAGAARRLLEVSYAVPADGAGLRWWDGVLETRPRPAAITALSTMLRFPLSAAYGTESGVALGVNPNRILSAFATGAVQTPGGLFVSFATRLVVDPGQTVSLPLYAFAFRPRYGYLDAVQRVYALFPERFSMAAGVRARIIGGGGYLFSNRAARHLQIEYARRFGMGWEWAYCPAQIPGDWYADERFYDPNRGYAGDRDRHANAVKGSLDDYRRDMRERFQGGWPGTVLGFYMLPHAADEVVLKAFPDGRILDAKGQPTVVLKGWIKTDAVTRMTYPWGNAYGREVVREIRQIAEDFQPGAIAFDEAYIDNPQFGAGIEGEPARTWNEEGVYAGTQVALAHLADAIHQTRVRDCTLGAIFNKPFTYNTATRCDLAMHEWPPYENLDSIQPVRLMLGHKAYSWWHGAGVEKIVRWQDLAPEQVREAIAGMSDYVRLMSLRYGAFPMNLDVAGHRQLVEMMPVLAEMLRQGWQAVPAARSPRRLWLSRYGDGLRTSLVAGNPSPQSTPADLRVDLEYLGPGHFLFANTEGRPLRASSANGAATLSLGSLPGHAHAIAKALVQVQPDRPTTLAGSAQCAADPLQQGSVEATWEMGASAQGVVSVRLPNGAIPLSLTLNGVPAKFAAAGGAVRYRGNLPRRGRLRLVFRPRVVVEGPAEALREFPFVAGEKPLAVLLLPAAPTEQDRLTAARLSAYFEWYFHCRAKPDGHLWDLPAAGPTVRLPVVAAGQEPAGAPLVELRVAPGPASLSVSADGRRLLVRGATPTDREAAMLRLLHLLDAKYPFFGVLPSTPVFAKAGLAGKHLP